MNPLLVLQFLPVVLQAAVAIENLYASEPGATKAKLITDSVQAALSVGGSALPPKTLSVIQACITGVVATLNALGLFAKKTPAAS